MKRMISLLLCMLMVVGMLPMQVFAVEETTAEPLRTEAAEWENESIQETLDTEQSTISDFTYIVLDDTSCEITEYTGSNTEVTIPSEINGYVVKRIGSHTFSKHLNSLTSVTILSGVTDISGVFRYCSSLTNVTIPDSVTNISDAFIACPSLTSITIPGSVTDMVNAFYRCRSLTDVTILDGVTDISDAFNECISLANITIPDSVIDISGAFNGCTSLTSITIPDSVTDISEAFNGCTSLASVTIPDSVTDMFNAFGYCTSLTNITISTGITNISGAFNGCSSLTSITIPDSVTDISDAFRSCTSLTSITIPDSVTNISDAFSGCSSLTSITIPNSVTNISGAFSGCSSLTSITIPDSVTSLAKKDIQASGTFQGCTSLTNIVIPDSVTDISSAFGGCTSLTSITIPDSVTDISGAFWGCTSLTSITIPDSVTDISEAFNGCTSLTSITIPNGVTDLYYAFANCTSLTNVTIPNSVTNMSHAFPWCTSLTNITIPDSVTNITNAFVGCTSLTSITLPDSVTDISYAFSGCTSLTSITIPDGVTHIYRTFEDCTSLTNITIPDSVTYLTSAFPNCTSLTSITIPSKVTSLETMEGVPGLFYFGTFQGCASLQEIKLPDSLEIIDKKTFRECTSLQEIDLPVSLGSIDDEAFSGCNALTRITFSGRAPSIGQNAFYEVTATAYYPSNDSSWTVETLQNYGGNITWIPYDAPTEPHDHSYTTEVTAPNCTERGYTIYSCACGDSYVDDYTDALGHAFENDICRRCHKTLEKLEETAKGNVKVETADVGMDAAAVTIVGAKLNDVVDETKDIVLRIGVPENEKLEVSKDYDADVTVLFSMTLENVASTDPLQVPVKITLPIPAAIDPQRAVILHYNADGTLRQTIQPTISADEKYASFILTSFCDFAITQKHQHQFVDGFCACGTKEAADVKRVAGGSRYSTCTAVADELKATLDGKPFDAVVVASGADFPDALAGTYLAAVKKAPILLIADTHIDMMVEYIDENMADSGTIYILGSENSVSAMAEEALKTVGNVKRLGGKSRFITNLRILEEVNTKTGELLVVYSVAPWDALSVSSSGKPILLVNDKLRDDQKQYLETTGFDKITIIGSTAGVPGTMEEELRAYCSNIDRVYGKNRFMTSIEVAEYFYGTERGSIVVACGTNFPDGLCSGALAHAKKAPVILTDAGRESLVADYVTEYNVQSGYVIGSAKVVSDASVRKAFHMTETDVIK